MDKKGSNVDAEIRLELAEFKDSINTMITNLIKEGFKEIKSHLTELLNKDIDYIKDTQDRHSKHHTEHFTNNQNRIQDISDMKTLVIEQKIKDQTKDHIEEKTNRKKEIGIGYVILICTVVSAVAVIITLLIK